MGGAEGPVEAFLGSYAFQAGEERLDGPRWRTHDNPPPMPHGSEVSDEGGICWLALCADFAANIVLSLRLVAGTGRAPSNSLLPLLALEGVEPRAEAGFADARFGEGSLRWVPEDALPTIARPPTRSEMVQVFLQRAALKDGPPGRGPVSHADSVLLTQGEPPDANLQGVCVGRLTHAYASEGAGVSLCACALCLPGCSSGVRCGREGREGRSPSSPPP